MLKKTSNRWTENALTSCLVESNLRSGCGRAVDAADASTRKTHGCPDCLRLRRLKAERFRGRASLFARRCESAAGHVVLMPKFDLALLLAADHRRPQFRVKLELLSKKSIFSPYWSHGARNVPFINASKVRVAITNLKPQRNKRSFKRQDCEKPNIPCYRGYVCACQADPAYT